MRAILKVRVLPTCTQHCLRKLCFQCASSTYTFWGPAGQSLNDVAVKEFHEALARSPDTAVAVAAIKALTTVIRLSTAQTMMGLGKDLEEAAQALQR